MGCLQENARLALSQSLPQGLIAACAVGVEDISRSGIALPHGFPYALVAIGGTAYQLADALVAASEEVVYAGEIAGIAHVHGVGQGLSASPWVVFAGLQILVENVVGVVGGYKSFDGQPHHVAENACRDVAEIATWHADHQVIGLASFLEPGVGIEVIEGLGQEAGHVDGVGGSEFHMLVELFVHESGFHQGLAIVENAIHFQGGDILPQGGELAFLYLANLSFGVEHIHMDALHAQESVGYGRACVPGSSHEHVDGLASLLAQEVA